MEIGNSIGAAALVNQANVAQNNKVSQLNKNDEEKQSVAKVSEFGKQLSDKGTIENVGNSLTMSPSAASIGSQVNLLV